MQTVDKVVTLVVPPDVLNVLFGGLELMPYRPAKAAIEFLSKQILEQINGPGSGETGAAVGGGERSAGQAVPALQGQPGPVEPGVRVPNGSLNGG